MPIPNELQQRIESFFKDLGMCRLKKASEALSKHYRVGESLKEKEELLAYLIVRFPATFAVLSNVLTQLTEGKTLLDLGAGPGTASWATSLKTTAIEKEPLFIELGEKLGACVHWIQGDFCHIPFEKHDWVLFSYSLGELPEHEMTQLLPKVWQAASFGVVIVEPGTTRGYQRVIQARKILIEQGGFVMAPCPHSLDCPLQSPDWCHFSARLQRTHLHRFAKKGELSYEDEKYSYVIVTKNPHAHHSSRVIKPPKQRSGHTILPLCTSTGLKEMTISRRQKMRYKQARKLAWGDLFE